MRFVVNTTDGRRLEVDPSEIARAHGQVQAALDADADRAFFARHPAMLRLAEAHPEAMRLADHGGGDAGAGDDDAPNVGADARWNAGCDRIMREQGVSLREAGEILSLREPGLWHARREELAGMRIPNTEPRNNRHRIADGD